MFVLGHTPLSGMLEESTKMNTVWEAALRTEKQIDDLTHQCSPITVELTIWSCICYLFTQTPVM